MAISFPYKPGALAPPSSIAAPTIPVIPPAPRPPDIDYAAMIDQLFSSPPDFSSQAQSQLAGIYDLQFQQINNKKTQAQQSAKTGDKQLDAMYRALQGSIGSSQKDINAGYDTGIKTTNAAYAQGKKGIQGNYSTAANTLASMMKQLGIEAAAPDVLAQGANQSAFLQSLLDANNVSATNLLAANKQSAGDFNTAQKNIAGFTGTERRADLQNDLRDRLASLDDASLGLSSQMAQQKAQFMQDLQNAWGQQQQGQANQLFQQMQWDADARSKAEELDYNRVQDAIKAQNGGADALSPKDQWSMMGPVEKGYSKATQILGPDQGSKAMNLIMQIGGSKQFTNGFEFAAAVAAANQANARGNAANLIPPNQLSALAAMVYDEINPRSPSYLQYLNQQ